MRSPEAIARAKRRYRERHRLELREKGRIYSEHRRREMGVPALGSAESSENRRRAAKLTGVSHPNWKGNDVGYFALHKWVDRHVTKTGRCAHCGEVPEAPRRRRIGTEWANVSGEYRRRLSDYIELCIPCHRKFDRREQ